MMREPIRFVFEDRPSDSPLVDSVWRTQSAGGGSFISVAESHWGIVFTRYQGRTYVTVRGPEAKAVPAPVPEDAAFFGIVFKHGAFMPHLPPRQLVSAGLDLPNAAGRAFWLHGAAWEFPDFENADTFVERLARQGLLVSDPLVAAVLRNQPQQASIRTVQRRFLLATGLTPGALQQIERARRALALLQQGVSILDTVCEAGYYDQPHLTRALRYYMGQTPAQILRQRKSE